MDGSPISTPVVREAITDGNAEISGNFNIQEARELIGRLNSGALPVPIDLLSSQTIGASLGESALDAGVRAGVFGTGTYLPLTFYTGGSERMRIGTGGKVSWGSDTDFAANPSTTAPMFVFDANDAFYYKHKSLS